MVVLAMRRDDLTAAKGLAILLVVFGHLVARADPAGVSWYEPLRRAVYSFHMPFFFYLSGLAAAYSGAAFAPPRAWGRLAARRGRRLLLPFFALGLLIVFGKSIAGGALFVDNAPTSLADGLIDLVWHTAASPARSIWYAFVLFVFSLAAPLLIWLGRGRLALCAAIAAALYFTNPPDIGYAAALARYAIFFVVGLLAGRMGAHWLARIDRLWKPLTLLFAALLTWVIWRGDIVSPPVTLALGGFMSIPVLHGLVRHLPHNPARIFLWLGRYCFMIYLFNTLFIGLAKAVLLRFTSWDGSHFLPFAAFLMLAGTLGPVALKQTAFRRSQVLTRLTN